MRYFLKAVGLILLIISLLMGFSNPDSATHYSALKKFRENQLAKNALYLKLPYEFRFDVGRSLIDNWDGPNPEGRENYLIYSKIKNVTFGALNNVWVLLDENKFDLTGSLEFTIANKLNEIITRNQFSDVINICNIIIEHHNGSTKYNSTRDGFFHSLRARALYYNRYYDPALKDLSKMKKDNVLSSYDYYTYYLIYDNYFGNHYNPQRAQYYLSLYEKTKEN